MACQYAGKWHFFLSDSANDEKGRKKMIIKVKYCVVHGKQGVGMFCMFYLNVLPICLALCEALCRDSRRENCLILPGTLDNPVYTEVYTGRKKHQRNGVIAHRKCLLRKSFSHKSDSFACLVSSIQRNAHLRKRQRKCLPRKSFSYTSDSFACQ